MNDAIAWHDRNAAEFAARYALSPAFRERLDIWKAAMENMTVPGAAVLDAGCGPGHLARAAAARGCAVLGIDGSAAMIALARETAAQEGVEGARFQTGRIGQPDLIETRRFDLVLCSSVLEYLDDWRAGLDWLASAVAPGGSLLFSLPNGGSLYRKVEQAAFAVTGRPAYYENVRAVPAPDLVLHEIGLRGLTAQRPRPYGKVPALSPLARRIGCARRIDTLMLYSCRKEL